MENFYAGLKTYRVALPKEVESEEIPEKFDELPKDHFEKSIDAPVTTDVTPTRTSPKDLTQIKLAVCHALSAHPAKRNIQYLLMHADYLQGQKLLLAKKNQKPAAKQAQNLNELFDITWKKLRAFHVPALDEFVVALQDFYQKELENVR